jgi:TusA-related sulfurtransferase
MSLVFVNQKASQALRGEAVKVTLDSSATINYLSGVTKGQLCTVSGTNKTGTVYKVDYKGNSFLVRPITDNDTFNSTGGYLAVGATVTVG